jgi:Predicted xylanase/chitin deacetylase
MNTGSALGVSAASPWRWPGGARLAVWVIPNIEMFDEKYPVAGKPAGDTQAFAIREYGNRQGLRRIRRLLERYQIRATVALNSRVAEVNPSLIGELSADGWEMMGHGDVNNRRLDSYATEEEGKVIRRGLEHIAAATGMQPKGWLSPGLLQTPRTLSHLADNGIEYVADFVNDDVPYTIDAGAGRTMYSIPYATEANDRVAYGEYSYQPDQFADIVIRQFDYQYDEAADASMVFPIALHPFLSGVPHRMPALERILKHVVEADGVWMATGSEIMAAHTAAMLEKV